MKVISRKNTVLAGVSLVIGLACICPQLLRAQPAGLPTDAAPTADGQRNAFSGVQSQAVWLQNACRSAPNFRTGGYDMLWEKFQGLRGAYNAFKSLLSPQQMKKGANELAELGAGLDILQEAFTDYQEDLVSGQSSPSAFVNMCQVLRDATGVWLQELNKDSQRLRVGWP